MANNKVMDSLLKWSIAAQGEDPSKISTEAMPASMKKVADEIAAGKRPDLQDPALFDAIMGKSEAVMMQEELAVALDEKRDQKDREVALDNFEMLIESLDNANNINSMGMWPPLLSLLSSPLPSIQTGTLWIVGTAVQNNDKAQTALLKQEGSLASLLKLVQVESAEKFQVRAKAVYALSALLKHNPPAVDRFDKEQGWDVLKAALDDPNITIRRKVAFLLNTLLMQEAQYCPPASDESSTKPSTAISSKEPEPVLPASVPASSAPLERGPTTLESGIAHPPVAPALLVSGSIATLLSSLLPSSDSKLGDGTVAREDVDYAEKALRTVISFTDAVADASTSVAAALKLDEKHASMLSSLAEELEGKPLSPEDAPEGVTTRWQELGLEAVEWEQFRERASNLSAGV